MQITQQSLYGNIEKILGNGFHHLASPTIIRLWPPSIHGFPIQNPYPVRPKADYYGGSGEMGGARRRKKD